MEETHRRGSLMLRLRDMLMTYYHVQISSELLNEDKSTSDDDPITIFVNHSLSLNVRRHRIVLDDLISCTLTSELQNILESPIVFVDSASSFTYESEIESFGCFYDDPVANEWSNNMIHLYLGPRRSDIVMGLVFSLQLARKLSSLNRIFVVMMLYGSNRKDSVKVSFYMPREGYPGLFDIKTINEKGLGRLLLITNEGNKSF